MQPFVVWYPTDEALDHEKKSSTRVRFIGQIKRAEKIGIKSMDKDNQQQIDLVRSQRMRIIKEGDETSSNDSVSVSGSSDDIFTQP